MSEGILSTALEREHREIDGGIEAFTAGSTTGDYDDAALLRALSALRRHIYLEEVFLFPPLREAGLMMPIMVMEREHGELWQLMDTVQAAHDGGTAPAELVSTCQELLSLLDRHNSKEEPIIYPQADAALEEQANVQLQEFIASGTMPDGWVCNRAGT
ncbi:MULTISPECIES: hemerythrin domain-containing protein [Micrococcaceae]|uniref:Hemerythrin HHE cation binding domain protein n=1 Tax=Arthrobacter rhombi TaxID=71253 RepID=A0A1R4FL85_9MICC|nr:MULTISPECIES: hemerythrin domain-containing protein [Micrococcaceae]PCC25303.1 hemerythrin [Glutamicibacter sp. BW78]SJM56688.1 Hemerythrin HHE cation binding domain protein [Arthrobacter rhombi]